VFAPVRTSFNDVKTYNALKKSLAQHAYEHEAYEQLQCKALKLSSNVGESAGDFQARLAAAAREQRDEAVQALKQEFAEDVAKLNERLARLDAKVAEEKSQANAQMLDVALSAGAGILGALFGRSMASASNVRRASAVARSAGRAAKGRRDVQQAEDSREQLQAELAELDGKLREQVRQINEKWDPAALEIETKRITPRKADIMVEAVRLAWLGV
jgi:hypothetical protein